MVRSLSLQLLEKGIRVNGVAPGPVWTPLVRFQNILFLMLLLTLRL